MSQTFCLPACSVYEHFPGCPNYRRPFVSIDEGQPTDYAREVAKGRMTLEEAHSALDADVRRARLIADFEELDAATEKKQ